MTLSEIGEKEHIGNESVRQNLARALRKLRHPVRLRSIEYGVTGIAKLDELSERETDIKKREKELQACQEAKAMDFRLSPSAYNILKKAGCKSLEDVMKIAKDGHLLSIRNMYRSAAMEILLTLKKQPKKSC